MPSNYSSGGGSLTTTMSPQNGPATSTMMMSDSGGGSGGMLENVWNNLTGYLPQNSNLLFDPMDPEEDYSLPHLTSSSSLGSSASPNQLGLLNNTMLEDEGPIDDNFSSSFQVCIYILYNTVFIAAVLGNVLVCYVVFSSPRMRTVTNYLIANLALGDLLMAVLCVPFSYIPVLYQYWPFGQILCHVVSPAQAVCVFVSAYTLVALAGDRYMAILYPLKPRLRRPQAVIAIFVVWAIAILTAVPVAIYTGMYVDNATGLPRCEEMWGDNEELKLYYSLALMILQYFFPLAVLVFTYTRIALAVWGKKAPGEAEDGRDQRLAKAKRKMIKMMLTVVIVYTVSWLPFNTLIVCADIRGPEFWNWDPIRHIFFIVHWMAMSHTVCNPIIYCWMNSRFRVGFRTAVSRLPLIRRLLAGRNLSDYDYRLQRMGTCTTYTFAPNGTTNAPHGKLNRGSSLISNRTTYSDGGYNSPNIPLDGRDRSLGRNSMSTSSSNFAHVNLNLSLNINGHRGIVPMARLNNNSTSTSPHHVSSLTTAGGGVCGGGGGGGNGGSASGGSGDNLNMSRRGSGRRDSMSESFM